jgi:hypothetical protein
MIMLSKLPHTRGRHLALIIGVPIVSVLIGWSALTAVAFVGRGSYSIDRTLAIDGGSLTVAIDDGNLNLEPSRDAKVHLSGVIAYSLVRPTVDIRTTPAGVSITTSCPLLVPLGCSFAATVAVPTGVNVTASSLYGDVTATKLSNVSLDSNSGNVRAVGLEGTAHLRTDYGSITATALRTDELYADDDSGGVSLGFTLVPGKIVVSDSYGDVNVTLPPGERAYNVAAHSSYGSTSVQVPTDSSSADTIAIAADAGNVTIAAGN